MRSSAWRDLLAPHAVRLAHAGIPALSATLSRPMWRVGPILACFARQQLDDAAWRALFEVARLRAVESALAALFAGEPVNRSEARPALHTALRGEPGATAAARAAHEQARVARRAMQRQVEVLRASPVTDLVHIGIGGSDLGPRLVLEALREFDNGRFRVHFLSSADGHATEHLLQSLEPARTAAILVSKSFGTQETRINGARVRDWLGSGEHLYAVTAKTDAAHAFGVPAGHVLPLWDWVGGRYSVWSPVGFVLAAALGMGAFERLLDGAAQMDAHVRTAPMSDNLAVAHGLVAIWNRNALGHASHAILPYDTRLARLPAYLQQLLMESLGKSVTHAGAPVEHATGAQVWGGNGADAQHSFFQALHQGTDVVPTEFIGVMRPNHAQQQAHDVLLANLLAQTQALAGGATSDDPRKLHPGNRPSTILLLDELSPEALGALLALYEHSTYVQAVIWDINPFDQWGVELGKRLANQLLPALDDPEVGVADPITARLLAEIRRVQGASAD